MPRYQLADKCLYVSAKHHVTKERIPKEIPFPHILDQRKNPWTYLKLNNAVSYITRFIVLGVDTDLIPEIVRSEYGAKVENPKAEVENVLKILKPYLKKRVAKRRYQLPKTLGEGNIEGGYDLDCGVRSIPFTFVKYPIG